MDKKELARLALLGISAGLMVTGCQKEQTGDPPSNQEVNGDIESFYNSLTPKAKQQFMQLDTQHKMLAIELYQQHCKGENNCADMGGDATSQHACAGQNTCKGGGGAPLRDPNKAVEIQFNHQMKYRHQINSGF
jgi:hypothetical protein